MDRYVMFGHSGLFGDYVEIVHALGGRVAKLVTNVPDVHPPRGRSFATRFAEYAAWTNGIGGLSPPAIESLDRFRPSGGEKYVVGFRGKQLLPLRELLRRRFALRIETLIHPSAVVSPTAELGEGVIVNAGAVVASRVRLGDYVLVNRGATVGHDCCLGDFTNLGPGSHLASSVRTGEGVVVGIGASVIERRVLGEGCLVAAGSAVIRDVAAFAMVAGVPAIFKKRANSRSEAA